MCPRNSVHRDRRALRAVDPLIIHRRLNPALAELYPLGGIGRRCRVERCEIPSVLSHRQAEVLRKGRLQRAGANRANDAQDQALQTYRAPLGEDRKKLCPRARLRLHLDQIRPRGLESRRVV
jgi:hypothetical protein